MMATPERVFKYLETYVAQHGYPPSVREIGKACGGISNNTVIYNLVKLKDAGRVTWNPRQARTLRIVKVEQA